MEGVEMTEHEVTHANGENMDNGANGTNGRDGTKGLSVTNGSNPLNKPDEQHEQSELNKSLPTPTVAVPSTHQPTIRICGICHTNESKYKCAKCKLPYCSVACATLHRADHPPEEEPKPQAIAVKAVSAPLHNAFALAGTRGGAQAVNPFSVLENTQQLGALFVKFPRLKSQLRDIYAFTLPPPPVGGMSMNQYQIQNQNQYQSHDNSNQRGRGGRGGRGGKTGRPDKPKGPWNTDQGMQDAIDALGRAKEEYGPGGEGIREYVELVMKLVNTDSQDVAQIVQDEVTAENARLIQQLLDRDSY